ncbi:DUF3093 domain-containing protein [Haloechinothrix halophila]|uniref:DUF3093 domain-containing protein n=1 Tax=Haloechinothrix halophila TaxID=1069073 RepID=UPI00068470B1|nr:DUF3093 domain-containing protein [Haloechinothrix halophila]
MGASSESGEPSGPAARTAPAVIYTERLYVAWWGWLLPLAAAVLIAFEVGMAYDAVPAWLPYVVTVPLALAVLLMLGKTTVRITTAYDEDGETELHVGNAHLPVRYIGDVEVIAQPDKRIALGPGLDPVAFVVHRGWIGSLLRVEVADERDPTPYWLFSTRKPERVAALLTTAAGRDGSSTQR